MRRRQLCQCLGAGLLGTAGAAAPAGGRSADSFEPLDRLALPGATDLVVGGETAYVTTTSGFATVDAADPSDLAVLARREGLLADHPEGPLADVRDGKLGGDHYAVGAPAHPGAGGPRAAVVFDVSDPAAPRRTLVHETEFHHHNLDVDDGTLYLCGNDGDRNPLVCVDVETGAELGRWSVLEADGRWADVHHELRELHDVRVEDGVAYCSYWNAGTWLVDVSDPTDPTPIAGLRGVDPEAQAALETPLERREARFRLPGNDHLAAPHRGADTDLVAIGEEAWGENADAPVSDLGGVELWDAARGERLARVGAPPTEDATTSGVWTTAHNFDLVGDRLYTSWYRGGVRVFDVSDPAAPAELARWRSTDAASFWTAQRGPDCVLASSWRDHTRDRPQTGAAVYAFPEPDPPTPTPTPTGTGTAGDGAAPGLLAGAAGVGLAALARRLTNRERPD